jgi:hypothetical protein
VVGRHSGCRYPVSVNALTPAMGGTGYFFSVTVIAGDSCGLSVCFVNPPIGSAVDVDRT